MVDHELSSLDCFVCVLGFLTAMRQEVTRLHKGWSLDTVTIDNIVLRSYKDDIREAPTEVNLRLNQKFQT
jgi:hypothetical protein